MPYEHVEYPKWKYSHDAAVIVNDAGEEADLGAGWFDNPADVPPDAPAPEPVKRGPGRPRKIVDDAAPADDAA